MSSFGGLKKEANDYAEVAKRWPTCRILSIKQAKLLYFISAQIRLRNRDISERSDFNIGEDQETTVLGVFLGGRAKSISQRRK